MLAKNKGTLALVLLLIVAIVYIVFQSQSEPKTGYIVIQELYDGFEMKKEMEKKFLAVKNARDKILDSLTLELKVLSQKIQVEQEKNSATLNEFDVKRAEYMQRKQTYEEDNNALSQKYDQEILTQLNQYSKDFGAEHGYTYIYGNDGNGSMMYAKDEKNITKEVIEFINNKYRGVE